MNKIVCRIDPGLGLQHVYYFQDEKLESTEAIPYSSLGLYLLNSCYQEDCYNLHLFGNYKFLEGIIQEITAEEATKYNTNKIQMEIN